MIKAVLFDVFETQVTIYQSPLYLSMHMAKDAGIPAEQFKEFWQKMDEKRTLGYISLDEAVEIALKEFGCYSQELRFRIVNQRIQSKRECFNHIHPEIIPLLAALKNNGIKIGVISNCFTEEAKVIKESCLFPYYDSVSLSCELSMKKPDQRIFRNCINNLSVDAKECVYVGDGGCLELETASALGMHAIQAMWYVNANNNHPTKRNTVFEMAEKPFDILKLVNNCLH